MLSSAWTLRDGCDAAACQCTHIRASGSVPALVRKPVENVGALGENVGAPTSAALSGRWGPDVPTSGRFGAAGRVGTLASVRRTHTRARPARAFDVCGARVAR
jgi:hypothetical protein